MKNQVKILFDKTNATYHSGDLITGRVIVKNSGVDEVLELTWNGKQNVYWETHQPTSSDKSVSTPTKKKLPGERPSETDTITYFRTTQILTDYQQSKSQNEYQFSFEIPPDCMPNVKGKYGGIAYWVTVKINNSRKEVAKGFNVLPSVPFTSSFLNLAPCKLVQGESGAIFKDGNYSMQISLPQRHYNRGETLSTTVIFINSSTKPITIFTAQLVQKIHYHSNQKLPTCQDQKFRQCQLYRNFRRNEKILVAEKKFRLKIEPGQEIEEEFSIEIPKKSIPTFESPLISVGYFMAFSSKTSSIFSKLQANIGITVGSKKRDVISKEDLSCSFSTSPPPSYHSECPSFHERIE